MEQAAPPRPGFFERRDPWGQGFSLWVVAAMLFVAPVAVFSLKGIRLDNDVENWLPENDPSALEFAWCRELFPEDEILVLTWRDSTLNDPRLPIVIQKLQGQQDEDGIQRGGLPYVSSVMHAGEMLARMDEFGIERNEALRRLQGTVIGRGWLKVKLSQPEDADQVQSRERIAASLSALVGKPVWVHGAASQWAPNPVDEENFDKLWEKSGTAPIAGAASIPEIPAHDLQVSWAGMAGDLTLLDDVQKQLASLRDSQNRPIVESAFFAPGSPIGVVVALSEAGIAEKNKALTAIRQAALDSFIADEDLVLGGRVVSGTELNAAVIRSAFNPEAEQIWKKSVILLSGLVGIIFALISLKSMRLGLLVIGISYYAALLGMAVVPLSGGTMNMVLVVMPTLLMVLSLSGAIHVANYWKHAVWEDPRSAVSRATKMAGQPCLLAAFTTALGLISLAGSQLSPVRDFGIYASIGVLISVVMVLYGLPSLLQMAPLKRVQPSEVNPWFWQMFGSGVCRYAGALTGFFIVTSLVCGYGLKYFQVETKVIRYFPEHSRLVQDFQTMEETLAGICPVEVIVRFDAQAQKDTRFLDRLEIVRQVEEEIRRHPEVSGTLSLADFQPDRLPPGENASTREKIFYNRRSNEAEKRSKSGDVAGASDLLAVTSTTPLPTEVPRKGEDELWRINAQCSILSDVDYEILTTDLSNRVTNVIAGQNGVDHFVTGTVPLFLRTQKAVLESLIWSFLMAFGLIALVMVWVLRDPLAGLVSMLPNILPVLSVFGLVSWFGQRIDIGTMVTASVALGIAVDGTLHLLTWFRDGLCRGMTRAQSVQAALNHCGPAMWQTSAAVGIGLLMLFPAELLLISRFGWLMAALILAALLADVVLLPSMLVGSLGKMIERRLLRRGEIRPAPVVVEETTPIPPHHLPLGKRLDKANRYVG